MQGLAPEFSKLRNSNRLGGNDRVNITPASSSLLAKIAVHALCILKDFVNCQASIEGAHILNGGTPMLLG